MAELALKLYVLLLGWAELDVGLHMPMEPERGERYGGPIVGYVIVTDAATILVDTGPPDDYEERNTRDFTISMASEDVLSNRLESIGLAPTDINAVIQTHLDVDHCGGNKLFTNRPIYIQRENLSFGRSEPERCAPQDWDLPGLCYHQLDGDADLYPGVEVIATPGHVPGHQSVLLRLPQTGTIILTGDAALTSVMFHEERVSGTLDSTASLRSIRRLKALESAEQAMVLIGHDADLWSGYRHAPQVYT